jgi:hypothetical protein
MPKPRVNVEWSFLEAIKLGERFEIDISPTPAETVAATPPSKRKVYLRAQGAVYHINNRSGSNIKLSLVLGDFRKKHEFNKAYIWCVKEGDKTFTVPGAPRGFRAVVIADERRKKKAAELPAQLEAAEAAQEATRVKHPPSPPNVRQVTKDETLRLVKLVEAHAGGEEIQELRGTVWVDAKSPNWTLPVAQLRLKPEPLREAWVLFERGFIGNFTRITAVYDAARQIPNTIDRACLVHYREVPLTEEAE